MHFKFKHFCYSNFTVNEFIFLAFFLPLFCLKLINFTPENKFFVIIAIICFFVAITNIIKKKYSKTFFLTFFSFILYTALLVFTSGKQGAFFSAISICLFYDIKNKDKILKILFFFGTIAVLVSCYIERNGALVTRFNGNELFWIVKRSNILYISYTAILCISLFLLKRSVIEIWYLFLIGIVSYLMYIYSGARSGLFVISILLVLLFIFRFDYIRKNCFFKCMCVLSPMIGMLLSYIPGVLYENSEAINYLDRLLEGRIRQANFYIKEYDLKLFGQQIYESTEWYDFCCLDSAYLDMLICYGVVFAISWLVLSSFVIKFLYDNNRFVEVSVMIIYAIYGINETFLPNAFFNVSLLLYADYLYVLMGKNNAGVLKYENKNNSDVFATIS